MPSARAGTLTTASIARPPDRGTNERFTDGTCGWFLRSFPARSKYRHRAGVSGIMEGRLDGDITGKFVVADATTNFPRASRTAADAHSYSKVHLL
jgi:hypothetical protein